VAGKADKIGLPQGAQNLLQKVGFSPQTAQDLFPTQAQQVAADNARDARMDSGFGSSPLYAAGKFVGGALPATALTTSGGNLLGGGALALSGGLSESAPAVANAVNNVSNFVGGTAGAGEKGVGAAVLRAASRTTNGAANGAAFNGLSGAPINTGALVGGALAPGLGAAGDTVKGAAQKAIPLLDAPTRELVQKAEALGIKLRAPQISNAPFVQYADSTLRGLPAMGYGATDAALHDQFNGAVARQMGENATKITPEVMQAAKARLGASYDKITPKLAITANDSFLTKLANVSNEASQTLQDSENGPIQKQVDQILSGFRDGDLMTGDSLHNMIKKGAPLDRLMQSHDPNVAHYASQLRQTLTDEMQAQAPPEIADQLAKTNAQYKAMKTIEPIVEKSTTGDISPALLMGQVRKSYGGMAYNGGGDMGDLARIGQRFMKEPPNSGTANRMMILHGLGGLGGLGALAASPEMGVSHLAAGATLAGTVAAGRGLKSLINSDAYYNALMGRSGAPVTNWLLKH